MMNDLNNTQSNKSERAKAPSARRRARELTLKGIYAWLINKKSEDQNAGVIEAYLHESENFIEADKKWFKTLLYGVISEEELLCKQFSPFLDRPLAELSPIEHSILLIGSYELIYHIEVPYRVVLNEAVELTKSFGGTEGFKFVNGVLDKLASLVRIEEKRMIAK